MKRKLLSLVLCGLLILSLVPAASARDADVPQAEKALVLRELDIMVGDETGDLHLSDLVTRAAFTKLLVAASTWKDTVGPAATAPYPDVPYRAWYAPYVRAAVDAGLVQGDLEGWFHPDADITLGEGATMLVRLLGYPDSQFASYRWPAGQMALYRSLDLGLGVAAREAGDKLTRADCLHLFYNLLTVNTRSGMPYGSTLGCALDREGAVDLGSLLSLEREGPIPLTDGWRDLLPFPADTALVYRDEKRAALSDLRAWDAISWAKDYPILFASSQSSMGQLSASVEGPVTVEPGWESTLPFPLSETRSVTRNGASAALADLLEGDLVYYSPYAKTLSAYRREVRGIVESVTPSAAAPSAVTVGGRSYPLETLSAQYAFSEQGAYRRGDSVTLLLGRSGGVAAVRPMTDGETITFGVLTALTTVTYLDAAGDPYLRKAVTVTGADGVAYTHPFDYDADRLSVGDLVLVTGSGGAVQVARQSPKSLAGTVSDDGTKLGARPLSPDVEILDTCGAATLSVPVGRLAGVKLESARVRSYTADENGVITSLILDNVTGDLQRYGVIADAQVVSSSFPTIFLQSTYTCDLGGATVPYLVSGKSFPVEKGPARLWLTGQTLDKIANLTPLENVALTGTQAVGGGETHTLSDSVLYYRYSPADQTWTLSTREGLAGLSLTAWYDAPDAQAGRVRIITGRKK